MQNSNLQTAPSCTIFFFLWHSTHAQAAHQKPMWCSQPGKRTSIFYSKIILLAEDYSIGNVEGVEILESPRIGEGCGLDGCEQSSGIVYQRMSRVTGIHVDVFAYLIS